METLAIVATKGGVGKTTLAVHLAVAAQKDGRRVLILDLDQQGSAVQWGRDRARLSKEHGAWYKIPLEVRPVLAKNLKAALADASAEGFDVVILDTPPHVDYPAAQAAELADLVLVPTRAGYFDLHAAKPTIALVHDLKVKAYFVVNQVPHTNLRIAEDAAQFLESKGLARSPAIITSLQPYVRALRDGLTAPELVPDGRHAQEIGALWAFVSAELTAAAGQKGQGRTISAPSARAERKAAATLLDNPFDDLIAIIRGDAA